MAIVGDEAQFRLNVLHRPCLKIFGNIAALRNENASDGL
jgi:hypothetical protein